MIKIQLKNNRTLIFEGYLNMDCSVPDGIDLMGEHYYPTKAKNIEAYLEVYDTEKGWLPNEPVKPFGVMYIKGAEHFKDTCPDKTYWFSSEEKAKFFISAKTKDWKGKVWKSFSFATGKFKNEWVDRD